MMSVIHAWPLTIAIAQRITTPAATARAETSLTGSGNVKSLLVFMGLTYRASLPRRNRVGGCGPGFARTHLRRTAARVVHDPRGDAACAHLSRLVARPCPPAGAPDSRAARRRGRPRRRIEWCARGGRRATGARDHPAPRARPAPA